MDPEDAAGLPFAILVARKAQVDHGNVTAVSQRPWSPWGHRRSLEKKVSQEVPSAGGVTKAIIVNHDTASAVSLEADVKQPVNEYVMINEKSTADSGSGLENDARQRGADKSYEEEKKAES